MYSITEVLITQLLCFIIVFNSNSDIIFFKQTSHFFYEFINFCKFISENNPLIIDYEDKKDTVQELEDIKEQSEAKPAEPEVKQEKFEEKYLEKFKKFPNEFSFTELELEQENEEYIQIRVEYEKNRFELINSIKEKLTVINVIQENCSINHNTYTTDMTDVGINELIKFFDIEEEYDDDADDFDLDELYQDLLKNKIELLKKMDETEKLIMTDEEMRKKAGDVIINKKLDKLIDNYVLEYTPLGNIYMRYNNDKKSFEYFSNNSMPYRYLEPVGRKYVMTYWCKPIFVDIEEELKRAETRYEEDKKKKEDDNILKEMQNNPINILAQLKNYNKDTKDVTMRPMKNRSNNNTLLPPQIKTNLSQINKLEEKQLLKENANRYTWEGRLTNFCPLKKIDRKKLDKKLAMTYADFKKMQQEQQNKK